MATFRARFEKQPIWRRGVHLKAKKNNNNNNNKLSHGKMRPKKNNNKRMKNSNIQKLAISGHFGKVK